MEYVKCKKENELKRLKSKSERMDFYAFLCAGAAGVSGAMVYGSLCSLCFGTFSFSDISHIILGGIGGAFGLAGCYNLLEKRKQVIEKAKGLEDDILREEFPCLFR